MANKKPAKKVMNKKSLRKTKGGASLSLGSNTRPQVGGGDPIPTESISFNFGKL